MSESNTDGTPLSPPRIWLQAEHYHVRQVPGLYQPHPEGLPDIARNCLLIGYPGVGKTMILKNLCAQLAKDRRVFPFYVQIEPWIANVSGEITYPVDRRLSPRDRAVKNCCTVLLDLGIIDRVYKHGDASLVKAATDLFPAKPNSHSEVPRWMDEYIKRVRGVLEEGGTFPAELKSFPSLFEVANTNGSATR